MIHRKFTVLGICLAVMYWSAESVLHRFVFSEESFEIIPSDFNEIWMRVFIVALILGFGLFADNRANKIEKAEQEKHEVFLATVSSTQHILNNLLNQLQLVFLELDQRHGLEDQTRKLLEQSIREGKEQVDRLSSVTEISGKTITESVNPK